jgi:hypothetical protein
MIQNLDVKKEIEKEYKVLGWFKSDQKIIKKEMVFDNDI